MSDGVTIALITGILAIIGGLIKAIIDSHHLRTKIDDLAEDVAQIPTLTTGLAVVRQQVQNSHTGSNLREDIDVIRDEVRGLRSDLADHRRATGDDLRQIRVDLAAVHQHDLEADAEHSRLWKALDRIRHPLGGDKTQEG